MKQAELLPKGKFESRADPEKLFRNGTDLQEDGLLTPYLRYECYRTRINERFNLDGGLLEHLRIIDWYLTVYHAHRRLKLPLSAKQMEYLNNPLPAVDFARPISVAAFTFIRRELGLHWDMADPKHAIEAVYWWCIERSPKLAIQDALIPGYFVEALNEIDSTQRWLAYQLNYFALRYHEVTPRLHYLDTKKETDRIALIIDLIFQCANQPHLTQFLPRDAMGRLFAPVRDQPDFITLDTILAKVTERMTGATPLAAGENGILESRVGSSPEQALSLGREMRQRILSAIERGGYSLRSGRYISKSQTGHQALCYDTRSHRSEDMAPKPGIALIGPINATSGLGQAARMSFKVLSHLRSETTVRDFNMDNPAPVGFASPIESSGSDTPQAINLIHLNA